MMKGTSTLTWGQTCPERSRRASSSGWVERSSPGLRTTADEDACTYVLASNDNPLMFHERWCTPLVVANTADRPGAHASPTRPGPATSSDAFPSGVILTIPRFPEREAAT